MQLHQVCISLYFMMKMHGQRTFRFKSYFTGRFSFLVLKTTSLVLYTGLLLIAQNSIRNTQTPLFMETKMFSSFLKVVRKPKLFSP